jgi:hypothetical protein
VIYMEVGFLYSELLLGAERVPSSKRSNVRRFLADVVQQRGIPLHVANLWNALYFHYDLGAGSYPGEGIDLDRIPRRRMNERDQVLPVGAFIRAVTGTAAGDLWAEVVYKEGRYPQVTRDWVPPEVSGAPAALDHTSSSSVAVLREALVLDFTAFGGDWNEWTPVRYARICDRGRWLDRHGHLVMDAIYCPDEAELNDASMFASHLLHDRPDGLLAYALEDEASDDEVRAALLTSLKTVADLAASCPELVRWGDYFLDRERFEACLKDDCSGDRIGRDDLQRIFRGVASLPARERTCYTAVGPIVLELFDRDGSPTRDAIQGPMYAASICHANLYILDRLKRQAPSGLLPDSIHLRLDDRWQWGGIWRAERTTSSSSLRGVDPSIPLHLGYATRVGRVEIADEPLEITSRSVRGWTIVLSTGDIAHSCLRLSEGAAGEVGEREKLHVRFRHDGEHIEEDLPYHPGSRRVHGMPWPFAVYPGIHLHCQVERGGTVVAVRSELLPEPIEVAGTLLRFACTPSVFERSVRLNTLRPVAREARPGTTLRDLISTTLRDRGKPTSDGGRELEFDEIVRCLFGETASLAEHQVVSHALDLMRLERRGKTYVWQPRVDRHTLTTDNATLEAYGDSEPGRNARRLVRRHVVPMFVRRLAAGQATSAEKRESYADARRAARMQHSLAPELAVGYTWVREHQRGGDREEE